MNTTWIVIISILVCGVFKACHDEHLKTLEAELDKYMQNSIAYYHSRIDNKHNKDK